MERIRRGLPLMTALAALAALVLCPASALHAAQGGLRLCVEMLFPALFPFFVVSGLLRLTGLPGLLPRPLLSPLSKGPRSGRRRYRRQLPERWCTG